MAQRLAVGSDSVFPRAFTNPVIGGIFNPIQPLHGRFRALNSDGCRCFTNWDLRLDKKIEFQRWSLTFYMDVSNVITNKASEWIDYNYYYTQRRTIPGFPCFVFRHQGEFS
jgi:hypothetical protein